MCVSWISITFLCPQFSPVCYVHRYNCTIVVLLYFRNIHQLWALFLHKILFYFCSIKTILNIFPLIVVQIPKVNLHFWTNYIDVSFGMGMRNQGNIHMYLHAYTYTHQLLSKLHLALSNIVKCLWTCFTSIRIFKFEKILSALWDTKQNKIIFLKI